MSDHPHRAASMKVETNAAGICELAVLAGTIATIQFEARIVELALNDVTRDRDLAGEELARVRLAQTRLREAGEFLRARGLPDAWDLGRLPRHEVRRGVLRKRS